METSPLLGSLARHRAAGGPAARQGRLRGLWWGLCATWGGGSLRRQASWRSLQARPSAASRVTGT